MCMYAYMYKHTGNGTLQISCLMLRCLAITVYWETFCCKKNFVGVGKPRKFNTRKFFYNKIIHYGQHKFTRIIFARVLGLTCIRRPVALVLMALLQFLQLSTGLPDSRDILK